MNFIRFFAAGMIGGLVGAAAWAVVTYFTNFEIGLIAWLVGVLAGVAVRAIAGDSIGSTSGAAAVVAALLCVGIGRFGASYLLVASAAGGGSYQLTEEVATSYLADLVVRERTRQGQRVNWPSGVDPQDAWQESDYPADVWKEAERRWKSLGQAERDRALDHPYLLDIEASMGVLADEIVEESRAAGKDVTVVEEIRGGEYAMGAERYPAEVWSETEKRWAGLTPAERAGYEDELASQHQAGLSGAVLSISVVAAISTISPWDALWFGLAGVSAWKIGSGSSGIRDS